jgi:1,4-dihydroxy-2-naphthoate octaprenyltransferase
MAEATTMAAPQGNVWAQAIRPFSFTASVVPVTVGAMIALWYQKSGVMNNEIMWIVFPLVVICSVLFQMGTNLVSDYYDYKKGIDREGTMGGSGVLVGKMIEPTKILRAGQMAFLAGFLLGLIMVWLRGTDILVLGIIGLLGGYFYSNAAFGYKYLALGDMLVFMLMGPLMVLGSYFVLTGEWNMNVFYISLPIGCLVTAILHANNLRDIDDDKAAGIKTVANVIGLDASKKYYAALVLGAYAIVVVLFLLKILEPWALVVFLSLPPALKNIKAINAVDPNNSKAAGMIDIATAQHHAPFGLLLAVGLALSAFF